MFENNSRTEIKDIGQNAFIDALTKNIVLKRDITKLGVGDDCAVLDMGTWYQLISTDSLLEGINFDLAYTPLKHLGYKAVVSSMSDILAMNGDATHLLVNVAFSNRFSLEAIQELYSGIHIACTEYNIDFIGGDTNSSAKGLNINTTCIGKVDKEKITYRQGSKDGDLLVVSGDLGGALMGLNILEREKRIYMETPDFKPDLEQNEYILERQLRPKSRVDIINLLDEIKLQPSAMIDISKGLANELHNLSKSSMVGFVVYENKLPIDSQTYQRGIDLGIDPTVAALNGGEDFELLFTIAQADYEKIKNDMDLTVIGYVVPQNEGIHLISKNNNKHKITAQGW